MFRDALTVVSSAQALTATALSSNNIDLGNPTVKNRSATGEPLVVQVQVDTAADFTTGDETYTIEVISSAASNMSSPTTLTRFSLLASQLTAGKKFAFQIPAGMPSQRYLGLNYALAGTTPSVTVTVAITPLSLAEPEFTLYPKAYSN